ncbi:unnamed protein product [Macrosiphum euphorbiae]|uniref:Uncharacterized protein n=1 Tax=Macrosiphum euphorbiae TaxID=13131 RepID=A0AAV0XMR5_9HEMI|nr:unnamed protein product [Macrosiphum euphorbiae]
MGDREGQSDSKFKGGIGRNSLIIQFITRNNSPGRHPIALIFLISYFDHVDPPAPGDSISHRPPGPVGTTPPHPEGRSNSAHPGHHQRIYYVIRQTHKQIVPNCEREKL